MSGSNPFEPSSNVPGSGYVSGPLEVRRVAVRPIELFQRGLRLLGDQYWLFVGITLVGVLIGSAVPFGILMGPMMIGIYLCYLHRELGYRVEFGTVFKGFDQFKEGLIAFLIMIAFSIAMMMGLGLLLMIGLFAVTAATQGGGNEAAASAGMLIFILIMYGMMIVAIFFTYLPFLFVFQLLAERQMVAMDAVKLSWQGVKKNLGGVIGFLFLNMIVSLIATAMCYFPAILFMPISFGAMYCMYRDIYGPIQGQIAPPVQAAMVM